MKAVTYSKYGPPEVLGTATVPMPSPGPRDVLIRVRAAEATKGDCELRSFRFAVKWFWLPLRLAFGIIGPRKRILGGYFAGTVERVGADVTGFAPGDDVFGCTGFRFGAYAEYVCLPASCPIVEKPQRMSFEEAAAVPLGGLNALHFLRRAAIQPGEAVLVNGAGGSIGAHAVQIAKSFGAVVTAVDAGHKEDMLRRIGADDFIDYKRTSIAASGRRWDVLLDMVARSSWSACLAVLKPGGRYLKANPRLADLLRAPLTSRLSDKTVVVAFAGERRDELEALAAMVDAGTLGPIVDRVYAMADAAAAHRAVEAEQRRGAIVIRINGA